MAFDVCAGQASGRREGTDAEQGRGRQQVEICRTGKLRIDVIVANAAGVGRVIICAIVVVYEYGVGCQIETAVAPKDVVAHGVRRGRGRGADREIEAAYFRRRHVGDSILGKGIVDDIRATAGVDYCARTLVNIGAIADNQVVFEL